MLCIFSGICDLFLIYLKKSFGLNVVCYAPLNDRLSGCD